MTNLLFSYSTEAVHYCVVVLLLVVYPRTGLSLGNYFQYSIPIFFESTSVWEDGLFEYCVTRRRSGKSGIGKKTRMTKTANYYRVGCWKRISGNFAIDWKKDLRKKRRNERNLSQVLVYAKQVLLCSFVQLNNSWALHIWWVGEAIELSVRACFLFGSACTQVDGVYQVTASSYLPMWQV